MRTPCLQRVTNRDACFSELVAEITVPRQRQTGQPPRHSAKRNETIFFFFAPDNLTYVFFFFLIFVTQFQSAISLTPSYFKQVLLSTMILFLKAAKAARITFIVTYVHGAEFYSRLIGWGIARSRCGCHVLLERPFNRKNTKQLSISDLAQLQLKMQSKKPWEKSKKNLALEKTAEKSGRARLAGIPLTEPNRNRSPLFGVFEQLVFGFSENYR